MIGGQRMTERALPENAGEHFTVAQWQELDHRDSELEQRPEIGLTWPQVHERVRKKNQRPA